MGCTGPLFESDCITDHVTNQMIMTNVLYLQYVTHSYMYSPIH